MHWIVFAVSLVRIAAEALPAAHAEGEVTVPASFVEDGYSIRENIIFPETEGEILIAVYCVADIHKSGAVERNYCFNSERADQRYFDAIYKAARLMRVRPAVLDGAEQSVHIWYRVIFAKYNEEGEVAVYHNWGRDIERYGHDYSGPQRVRGNSYPTACRGLSQGNASGVSHLRSKQRNYAFFILTSVDIGADGVPTSDAAVESNQKNLPSSCIGRIQYIMEHADYIPAFHRGKPVDGTFLEPWGRYDAMLIQ